LAPWPQASPRRAGANIEASVTEKEGAMATPASPRKPQTHEEPEITQEESVPTDGRDLEGEKLMKKVRNKKLEDPPGEEKTED
jgi:hypothetical protein